MGYVELVEKRPREVNVREPVEERAANSRGGSVVPALPDSVTTPMLIGLTPDAARDSLALGGLAVGPTLRALSAPEYAGRVFKQLPAPGTRVKRGRKVVLHIGLDGENP